MIIVVVMTIIIMIINIITVYYTHRIIYSDIGFRST